MHTYFIAYYYWLLLPSIQYLRSQYLVCKETMFEALVLKCITLRFYLLNGLTDILILLILLRLKSQRTTIQKNGTNTVLQIICILDHFFPFISALCSTNCIGLYSEDISHTEPKLQIDLLALYGAMKARTTKCLHYCCYTEYDYYIHIVLVSKALVVLCSI